MNKRDQNEENTYLSTYASKYIYMLDNKKEQIKYNLTINMFIT